MIIVDKDGEWFASRALYPLVDTSGGRQVRFEPQVPTKVKQTAWMKGQPLIVAVKDPTSADADEGVVEPVDDNRIKPEQAEDAGDTPTKPVQNQGKKR